VITALDTNVLLDLLIPDSHSANASEQALDTAVTEGALVIGEVVYAELASQFPSADELDRFLDRTHIRLEPPPPEALRHAAQAWRRYLAKRGTAFHCPKCGQRETLVCAGCGETIAGRQHILSDFLVGGHASVRADRLLTRDRGFYGNFFSKLAIVAPG